VAEVKVSLRSSTDPKLKISLADYSGCQKKRSDRLGESKNVIASEAKQSVRDCFVASSDSTAFDKLRAERLVAGSQ
jgi:hypothetical protein